MDQQKIGAFIAEIRKEILLRQKRFSDFFGGAGTGILVAALYCPDATRKIISICVALTMIGIGWILRAKFDKKIAG